MWLTCFCTSDKDGEYFTVWRWTEPTLNPFMVLLSALSDGLSVFTGFRSKITWCTCLTCLSESLRFHLLSYFPSDFSTAPSAGYQISHEEMRSFYQIQNSVVSSVRYPSSNMWHSFLSSVSTLIWIVNLCVCFQTPPTLTAAWPPTNFNYARAWKRTKNASLNKSLMVKTSQNHL